MWIELLGAAADINGGVGARSVSDRWAVGLHVWILICVEHKGSRQWWCRLCSLLWSTATVLMTLSYVPALILPSSTSTPPLSQAVHTVPQCQVSSSTAEMAKHTPFPHAWTLPEGEANRSASWVAASPLSAPHLSVDPCPASGATTRTRLSFSPSASSPRRLRVGKGEGTQTTMLRRQRSPCQGRSPEQCDDEVLGHSEGGPGVAQNLDLKRCRQNKKRKKKEAFAWRNTGHCLLLMCFYLVFSNNRKVKCDFLISLIKTAPSETLDISVIRAFNADFCPWEEVRRANSYWLQVSFHSNSQGRH